MSELKIGAGRLKSGNVGRDPQEIGRQESRVLVTKWFIAINIVLDGGKLALVAASPYFHTAAAAEREAAEIQRNYPEAAVLWATTSYDLEDAGQREELHRVIDQQAAERQQEGYQ